MTPMRKITISVPPTLVDDLDYLSVRLGVSRSAIISELMCDTVAHMRSMVELVPENPTPADARRFRGESAELIRQRMASLQGIADDLLADKQ